MSAHSRESLKKHIILPLVILFSLNIFMLGIVLGYAREKGSIIRSNPKAVGNGYTIKASIPAGVDLTGYSLYVCNWKTIEDKNSNNVQTGYVCPQGQPVDTSQPDYLFEDVSPPADSSEVFVILKPADRIDEDIKTSSGDCSPDEKKGGHCLMTLTDNSKTYQVSFRKDTNSDDRKPNSDCNNDEYLKDHLVECTADKMSDNKSLCPTGSTSKWCLDISTPTPTPIIQSTEKSDTVPSLIYPVLPDNPPDIGSSSSINWSDFVNIPRCDLTGSIKIPNCETWNGTTPYVQKELQDPECQFVSDKFYNECYNTSDSLECLLTPNIDETEGMEEFVAGRWECYTAISELTGSTVHLVVAGTLDTTNTSLWELQKNQLISELPFAAEGISQSSLLMYSALGTTIARVRGSLSAGIISAGYMIPSDAALVAKNVNSWIQAGNGSEALRQALTQVKAMGYDVYDANIPNLFEADVSAGKPRLRLAVQVTDSTTGQIRATTEAEKAGFIIDYISTTAKATQNQNASRGSQQPRGIQQPQRPQDDLRQKQSAGRSGGWRMTDSATANIANTGGGHPNQDAVVAPRSVTGPDGKVYTIAANADGVSMEKLTWEQQEYYRINKIERKIAKDSGRVAQEAANWSVDYLSQELASGADPETAIKRAINRTHNAVYPSSGDGSAALNVVVVDLTGQKVYTGTVADGIVFMVQDSGAITVISADGTRFISNLRQAGSNVVSSAIGKHGDFPGGKIMAFGFPQEGFHILYGPDQIYKMLEGRLNVTGDYNVASEALTSAATQARGNARQFLDRVARYNNGGDDLGIGNVHIGY